MWGFRFNIVQKKAHTKSTETVADLGIRELPNRDCEATPSSKQMPISIYRLVLNSINTPFLYLMRVRIVYDMILWCT